MRTMQTTVNVVQIIISNIPQTVYIRFAAFWNFSKLQFVFAHFYFYEISTTMMRTMLTMPNVVHLIFSNITPTVYIRYTAFRNSEISLCFAHFGFYEISTPVMRTIPIIGNFV